MERAGPMTPSQGKILFAEDDAIVRRATALALVRAGFMVTQAGDSAEVRALFEAQPFDLLLADINMPGNDGLELAEWVAREKLVPVVLLTGYPSIETTIKALRAGVADYIVKPCDPDELVARIETALERGRAIQAIRFVRQQADSLAATAAELQTLLRADPTSEVPSVRPTPLPAQDPLHRLPSEEIELLSPRERDVLRLLAKGQQVADIAKALGLSANTVRNHVKSMFIKLRVRSQVALLGKVAGHGGEP